MQLLVHKYFRLRRTLIDCSSAESRREGVLLYRPGRKWLRLLVVSCQWLVVSDFWFRILCFGLRMIGKLNLKTFDEILPGFDLEKALGCEVEYATIYTGNGSERSKYTLMVKLVGATVLSCPRSAGTAAAPADAPCGLTSFGSLETSFSLATAVQRIVVKVGNTKGAAEAIKQECEALSRLSKVEALRSCVPVLLEEGSQTGWTWSAQTVLPRGYSPNKLQQEHFEFLEKLSRVDREIGREWVLCHGDFTPWNCSIVNGKLVVWDWEDAHWGEKGEDEAWFKKQVEELLGVKG